MKRLRYLAPLFARCVPVVFAHGQLNQPIFHQQCQTRKSGISFARFSRIKRRLHVTLGSRTWRTLVVSVVVIITARHCDVLGKHKQRCADCPHHQPVN